MALPEQSRFAAVSSSRMDARQEADGSLLLTYDSSLWTKWLIGATLALLATAAYDYLVGRRGDERLIGLLAGAATCAITALVMLEQSNFRVDPKSRSSNGNSDGDSGSAPV